MYRLKNIAKHIYTLLVTSLLFIIFMPTLASAYSGTNYYWSLRIMFEDGSIRGELIKDKENTAWDESYYSGYQGDKTTGADAGIDINSFLENTGDYTRNPMNINDDDVTSRTTGTKAGWSASSYKPWTFPGISGLGENKTDRSNDLSQGNKINNKLVNDFNTALSMFQTSGGKSLTSNDLTSAKGKKDLLKAIAYLTVSTKPGMKESTLSFKSAVDGLTYGVKVAGLNDSEATKVAETQKYYLEKIGLSADKDTVKNYFIKVTPLGSSNKATILQFMYPKGYSEGEPLYSTYKSAVASSDQYVKNLSWFHVGLGALSSYSANIYSAESSTLYDSAGTLEKSISGFFVSIFNGIVGMVGADSVDNLVLNTGDRATNYYLGIAPESWFTNTTFILVVSYVVALTILGVAFVKNFTMGNLSILNPAAKSKVMEGLMNILYAVLGLTFYVPIIGIVFSLNFQIVSFCAELANGRGLVDSITAGGNWGNIIVAFVIMAMTIRINIMYIIRSLYVVALYATGPLFISSIGFSGKNVEMFKAWTSELLGQLFLQAFHAIIILIYIKIHPGGNVLIQCVLVYSFIPLGKLFRDRLLKLGGQNADNRLRSGKSALLGTLSGIAGGAASGAIAGKIGATSANSKGAFGEAKGGVADVSTAGASTGGEGLYMGKGKVDSMKGNDGDSGVGGGNTAFASVGGVAKKGLRAMAPLAGAIANTAIAAGVQAAGGNARDVMKHAGASWGVVGGQMAGGVSKMMSKVGPSAIKQKQWNSEHGIVESSFSEGNDGEPMFNGTYDEGSMQNQFYQNEAGEDVPMNATMTTDLNNGEIGFKFNPEEILDSGDTENPLYPMAEYCVNNNTPDDAIPNHELASRYLKENNIQGVQATSVPGTTCDEVGLKITKDADIGQGIHSTNSGIHVKTQDLDFDVKAHNVLAYEMKGGANNPNNKK